MIGIDIGWNGGIAHIDGNDKVESWIMPVIENKLQKKLDRQKLDEILQQFTGETCYIEKPQARGKISSSSVGTAFSNYGYLCGVLETHQIKPYSIHPVQWQPIFETFEVTDLEDKERSIAICGKLFPEVSLLPTKRSKKPHDGMADAICIAFWGSRFWDFTNLASEKIQEKIRLKDAQEIIVTIRAKSKSQRVERSFSKSEINQSLQKILAEVDYYPIKIEIKDQQEDVLKQKEKLDFLGREITVLTT